MREPMSLKVVDRFRFLLERFGCDYPLLRKILEVKLIMDARRVPTVMRGNRGSRRLQDNRDRNSFIRSLWLYAFMGLVNVPIVLLNQNYLFQMSITFGILMFLVMTSMISDFSSVLLDIRDRIIISTKPVSGRTVSFARILHIMIYLTLLTGALTGPALIAGLIRHGILFFLLFLATIILLDAFVLVVTALLYLLILNVFDGERLKDIVNYVQILLSLAIVVGYQLVAHSFDILKLNIAFHAAWWQIFLPPIWFGSVFAWLQPRLLSAQVMTFSVLALLAPIVLLAIYMQLMPVFERKLQKLAAEGSTVRSGRTSLVTWVSRLVCQNEEERAFFQFTSLMMGREREFKLKIYPSLGFAMFFPFIFMFNFAFSRGFHALSTSKWYFSIYMTAIMIPSVVLMLKFSSKHKAAWIYKATPIRSVAAVYRGTVKAFLVRLLVPLFLVESVIFVFIFGSRVIPQFIAAGLSLLIYTVVCFRLTSKDFPFSRPFEVVQQSNRVIGLVLLSLIGVLVGIHVVVVTFIPYGIYIYLALLLVMNALAWTVGFRVKSELRSRHPKAADVG